MNGIQCPNWNGYRTPVYDLARLPQNGPGYRKEQQPPAVGPIRLKTSPSPITGSSIDITSFAFANQS
jgi:hypothetical protein